VRLLVAIMFASLGLIHAAAALAWWWWMAGGFETLALSSFANRWIPMMMLLTSSGSVLMIVIGHIAAGRLLLVATLSFWLGLGVAARFVFPESSGQWWIAVAVFGALSTTVCGWLPHRRRRVTAAPAALVGVLAGVVFIVAQRGPEPTVSPRGQADLPEPVVSDCDGFDGTFELFMGSTRVMLDPLLTFQSVSPDRSWTALAPAETWRGKSRECIGLVRGQQEIRAWFETQGRAMIHAQREPGGSTLSVNATTVLDTPVFSHLNRSLVATFESSKPIAVRLSPCSDVLLDLVSDPESGIRFAYVTQERQFVIARAAQQEKGPFTTLCEAKLETDTPLVITIIEDRRAIGELHVYDWVDQAGTEPSPTAGWGVPVNAIELWPVPGRGGVLSISLAATSIGRGWHSVGHRAGAYANRVDVVVLGD
jgi:hypothetical protein